MALRSLMLITALFATGCTTLFFQPSKTVYPFIFIEKLKFEPFTFESLDGTKLSAWYLSSTDNRKALAEYSRTSAPTKGLVVQFHGNAENMTSHYRGVAWFLFEGYDVITFDYRGYGRSEGRKDSKGIYEDVLKAIRVAENKAMEKKLPLILYGQSLGGSMLLRGLVDSPRPPSLRSVIVESSFYSYQQIAREKLASTWITWPLQWLAWILISDRYSPGSTRLSTLSPIPVLLLYSAEDEIVPVHHGQQIYAHLKEPKQLWIHSQPGHINAMWVEKGKYQKRLLEYLDLVLAKTPEP